MRREVVGYTIGEATIARATFISKATPRVGQYVVLEYDGRRVLGLVKALVRGSVSLTEDVHDPLVVERLRELDRGTTSYLKGEVKMVGDVETLELPRTPPPPGTELLRANPELLSRVFGDEGKGIRIGVLLSEPNVPVYIDVNRLVSRHLAILAVTGAGKSNTVAVIAERIVEKGGCVLIFDMHSEYASADFSVRLNLVSAKLNPIYMSASEFLKLLNIDAKAYVQERYFREALSEARSKVYSSSIPPEKFLCYIRRRLEAMLEEMEGGRRPKRDRESVMAVLNKMEAFEERYSELLDTIAPPMTTQIRVGAVNVVDLGRLDEEMADVVVSHTLRRVLEARKRHFQGGGGLPYPLLTVLEEAHILAPRGRDTLSKYWIGRIAREGRKFGIGLCLVSQRPKALDSDALSQANNMVILRLVEPSDQRYVQQASELLSEDLLEQLSSLNVGEAVVIGPMIKVPALVKIDRFGGRRLGEDLDVLEEWAKASSPEPELDYLREGW